MKKLILSILVLGLGFNLMAQERSLAAVKVQNLDYSEFNTGDIENDGKPIIISFWATLYVCHHAGRTSVYLA